MRPELDRQQPQLQGALRTWWWGGSRHGGPCPVQDRPLSRWQPASGS